MSEEFDIPKHGSAGVAFLGVEFNDSIVTILGVFTGLGLGVKYGALLCIGCAAGGFIVNKAYLDWRDGLPPGHLRSKLFQLGLLGYSKALKSSDVVFVGDATVINPSSSEEIDRIETGVSKAQVQAQAQAMAQRDQGRHGA